MPSVLTLPNTLSEENLEKKLLERHYTQIINRHR